MASFLPTDNAPVVALSLGFARAQSEGRLIALRAQPGLIKPAARTTRAHVARLGTWKGHRSGEFTLDARAFRDCVRNYSRQVNALKFDYEHASLDHCPEGAPAAGWIQRVWQDGENLYATVDWTARAASMIAAGEYRFCSCVFVFDSTDRVTAEPVGCELAMVALTDSPFIDGLEPIVLD